jgi:hypothetical protein
MRVYLPDAYPGDAKKRNSPHYGTCTCVACLFPCILSSFPCSNLVNNLMHPERGTSLSAPPARASARPAVSIYLSKLPAPLLALTLHSSTTSQDTQNADHNGNCNLVGHSRRHG